MYKRTFDEFSFDDLQLDSKLISAKKNWSQLNLGKSSPKRDVPRNYLRQWRASE